MGVRDVAFLGKISAAGIPPQNQPESAILANLAPGAYTAIVGSSGIALVEFYDVSP